jgi:short-subunit dehydrogenase
LVVADGRAQQFGLAGPPRPPHFLQALARFDAGENWPNRFRQMAVVTGAASGIGCALAHQLHARGHGLCLVDRDAVALAAVAGRLGAWPFLVDLSDLIPAEAVYQLAGDQVPHVALVVNNAGVGFRGAYPDLDPAAVEKTLSVNVRAVVIATAAFAREMAPRGGGVIVNIASSAAFQPLPYMAVYAASKAFVLSFTLAAAAEHLPGGVHVLAVSPSGAHTNFQKAGGMKMSPGEKLMAPETVAAAILRSIERRTPVSIIGLRGTAMAVYGRLAPTRLLVRTWELLMRRAR